MGSTGEGVQGLVDMLDGAPGEGAWGGSYVKGSASAVVFGAARCERDAPGCGRMWMSGTDLLC